MSKIFPSNLIPKEFMKDLIGIKKTDKVLNRDTGKYEGGTSEEINFEGAILPLSSKDLNQLHISQEGIFSVDDKKVYTDQVFLNNTVIKDGDLIFKIYVVKNYEVINDNFKLYYMKRIGDING